MNLPDSKEKFPRTPEGKVLLRTPEEIARWIALGYEEQRVRRPAAPRLKIDLAGCDLATHDPATQAGRPSPRFSPSMLAGLAEGIREDGELTVVSHPVDLSDSLLHNPCLYGLVFEKAVVMRGITVEGYMVLVGNVFRADLTLAGFVMRGKLLMKDTRFDGAAVVKDAVFPGTCLSIDRCTFSGGFTLRRLAMDCGPDKAYKCLNMTGSRFDGPAGMEECGFDGRMAVKRCVFGRQFSINGCMLPDRLFIDKCVLEDGMTVISDSESGATPPVQVKFDRLELKGRLHFYHTAADKIGMKLCSISPEGRVKFTGPRLNALSIRECTVSGRADIIGGSVGRINLRETLCDGYITMLDTRCRNLTNSYTARLLKDQALKSNDTIRALDYRKAEMNLYLGELTRRRTVSVPEGGRRKEPLCDYLRRLRPGKISLLLFNKLSNDYGRSWGRGALFTALAAAAFFAAIWRWGLENPPLAPQFGDVWKSYLQILNLANWKDSLNGHELNAPGVTLFYLSRVFVSYGIYQTVAAFRKYGR